MATHNEALYDDLKQILYSDSAVAGEAAGETEYCCINNNKKNNISALAMGLVMRGSAHSRAISEMLSYANDTQHEKIERALAIGLALVVQGKVYNFYTISYVLTIFFF